MGGYGWPIAWHAPVTELNAKRWRAYDMSWWQPDFRPATGRFSCIHIYIYICAL